MLTDRLSNFSCNISPFTVVVVSAGYLKPPRIITVNFSTLTHAD